MIEGMASIKYKEALYMQLAAFIDGEGTIGIGRTIKPDSNYSYHQIISLGNNVRSYTREIKN